MDKDKLDAIHKGVLDARHSIEAKLDEHTKLHHASLDLMQSVVSILISLRDNTWHQYKRLTSRIQELLGWDKKGPP